MATEEDFARLAGRAKTKAVDALEQLSEEEWAADAQMLVLMEEVGELAAEYRAVTGRARHKGNWNALKTEMADVYISLKVLSMLLDIDIEDEVASKMVAIHRRGGI